MGGGCEVLHIVSVHSKMGARASVMDVGLSPVKNGMSPWGSYFEDELF